MLDELHRNDVQAETGFGTGLRAHLRERTGDDVAGDPGIESNPAPVPAPLPPLDPAAVELEALRGRLEHAEAVLSERERSLNVRAAALAAEAERLKKQETEVERRLDVRELLRSRAEREAERLWHAFDEALGATREDGEPDFAVRVAAARALLAEAYAATGDSAGTMHELPDELAVLRERRVQQQ